MREFDQILAEDEKALHIYAEELISDALYTYILHFHMKGKWK